ncbi:lipase 1-like [Anoplophora glabripennis]|uniref:lipase 1-like n=1 Tax=Anoplophora glabripennis TaxID=217634 RepID=UPI000A134185|nr:lipase 1-like [Anoplophora glabripennis]
MLTFLNKKNFIFLIMCLEPFLKNIESVRVCKKFSDYFFKNSTNCWENTDSELNVTQIIRKWGFNAEEHYNRTEDGYEILIVRSYSKITRSTPIVIGHGIYMNSLAFVDTGKKSLTYILNKLGYDVWLINFRGTRYSSNHDNLTTNDTEYWKFSFHEMGVYDLRETLNVVFKVTRQKSIYIGYSMGSTISYVFASTYPEEAFQLLKGIISLAPVAYLNNIKSVLRYGAPYWPMIKPPVQFIWKGKVLPRKKHTGKFCSKNPTKMYICEFIKVPIFGDDFDQMDPLYRPVTNILNPDTIGINVVTHFDQIIISGKFQQMDHRKGNEVLYGTSTPPLYQLSNINVPVSLFVGLNDWVATRKNAEQLCRELINTKCNIRYIDHKKWNHGDFVTAKDIKPLLNDPVGLEIYNIELYWKEHVSQESMTNLL